MRAKYDVLEIITGEPFEAAELEPISHFEDNEVTPNTLVMNGRSPYMDRNTRTWWVFNDETQQYEDSGVSIATDYNDLTHPPMINGVILQGDMKMSDIEAVYDDTTENWALQSDFVPRKGAVVIYSDYAVVNGIKIPNIKIGDGMAYLVDLPFVSDDLRESILTHVSNNVIHITAAERNSWNNKVTCYVEHISNNDYLIHFSKD